MKRKHILVTAALLSAALITQSAAAEANPNTIDITVRPQQTVREIYPMIYGVNSGVDLEAVSAQSMRLGGNRMTAYNWENNASNAGSDYMNLTDMYLMNGVPEDMQELPGAAALNLSRQAKDYDIPYTLLTLQMAGYVVSNKKGSAKEGDEAPSDFWFEVVNRKNGEYDLVPDINDACVYTDEYLNYLFENVGRSDSPAGFKAYALDNEPALWSGTHSLVHPDPITCAELIERTVDLSSVVKDMDPNADVFGPSLYGYYAYLRLQDAPDWNEIASKNRKKGYRWFIDYYLDELCAAETAVGRRLVDVLDLHYYTEAKGACGERSCSHYDNDDCITARLNSFRSLYDPTYRENSWIVDSGAQFFPLLPNIQESIDKFYPGTKLAFTEYDFGGGDHISGGVAQADTLGIFAEYGVYFASLWHFDSNEYQLSAINMFTNYDGEGSGFGNILVESSSSLYDVSVYASVDEGNDDTIKIIVTNRSIHDETLSNITIDSEKSYTFAEVYSIYGDSPEIRRLDGVDSISGNTFSYTLPALSVTEFVITRNDPTAFIIIIAAVATAVLIAVLFIVLFIKKKKVKQSS